MKIMNFLIIVSGLALAGQVSYGMDAKKKEQQDKLEAAKKEEQRQQEKLQEAGKLSDTSKKTEKEQSIRTKIETQKKAQEEAKKELDVLKKEQEEAERLEKEKQEKKKQTKATDQEQQKQVDAKTRDLESLGEIDFKKLTADQQEKLIKQIAGTAGGRAALQTFLKANPNVAKKVGNTITKVVDGLSQENKNAIGKVVEKLGGKVEKDSKGGVTAKGLFRGIMGLAGLGGVAGLIYEGVDSGGFGGGDDVDVTVNLPGQTGAAAETTTEEGAGVGSKVVSKLFDKAKEALPSALSPKLEGIKKELLKKVDTIEQNLLSAASEQLKKVSDSAGIVMGLGNRLLGEITDDMQTKIEEVYANPSIKSLDPEQISLALQTQLAPQFEKLKTDVTEILKGIRSGQKSYVSDAEMKNAINQTSEALKLKYKDYFQTLYQSVLVKMNAAKDPELKEKIKQGILGVANTDLEAIDTATKAELARKSTKPAEEKETKKTTEVAAVDDLFAASSKDTTETGDEE